MWDGDFCGSIGFRWQPGTSALPAYCWAISATAVVPWKQRRGYATRALALLLPEARKEGLDYVELTTDPDNLPSQKVITANGGALVKRFRKEPAYGQAEALLFRIPALAAAATGPHDGLDHRRQGGQPARLERARGESRSPSWPSRTRVMKPCTAAQAKSTMRSFTSPEAWGMTASTASRCRW